MSVAYQPSRSLSARISRRMTPFLSRRMLPIDLDRPLVSFTFDDCPVSAIDNGVRQLEAQGWHSTVYISGSLAGHSNHHGQQVSADDIIALHATGHEIAGHTWSHIDGQTTDIGAYIEDVIRNQDWLAELGLPPCRSFAYPYGQTTPELKRLLQIRFTGMRGIQPGLHRQEVDLNQIRSVPLFGGLAMERARRLIDGLSARPAWVTFFTHDIRDEHSDWGCAPEEFAVIIRAVKDSGAKVLPVADAIEFLKGMS